VPRNTKISDTEKEIINLEVEKSKLNREKSLLVLDKSMFLYFSFLFIGVIGFINGYINRSFLNILVVMGLGVLIIGIVPYIRTMYKEEENLNCILTDLKKRAGGRYARH